MDYAIYIQIKQAIDARQAGEPDTDPDGTLDAWLAVDPANQELYDRLDDPAQMRALYADYLSVRSSMQAQLEAAIPNLQDPEADIPVRPVHRVHFLKTAWFRSVAAAMLILITGSVAYLWKTQTSTPAQVQTNPVPMRNDVAAPSRNRATLTLTGGKEIFLDSTGNGTLATQGNVHIQKMNDGRIVYNGKSEAGQMQYNTLTVPRGSQVANIILTDGSKVFLNAASSLRYPVSFTGTERQVEIDGEAYFEVAKDPTKKFIVSSKGIQTEVLGTHFNINSYADEQTQTVTLLEGKVKVIKGERLLMLNPGQQAMSKDNCLTKNSTADLQQVVAWKDGLFLMGNQDMEITSFLRQVSRWYDVDIKYNGNISGTVGGSLSRQVNVSKVLELLETSGSAHYKIEGKTVIISPFK